VTFEEDAEFLYNVTICITGIDRYHLLQDVIECITSQQLSINSLKTSTVDCIATCTIDFAVHSACELQLTIDKLYAIEGIDHVQRER
jgi:GTP pyrophosphokinase